MKCEVKQITNDSTDPKIQAIFGIQEVLQELFANKSMQELAMLAFTPDSILANKDQAEHSNMAKIGFGLATADMLGEVMHRTNILLEMIEKQSEIIDRISKEHNKLVQTLDILSPIWRTEMNSPFLNSLSISGYDKIVLRESSHHCEDKNSRYDVLDFMKTGVVVFSINLHYDVYCRSRLLVAPQIPPQPRRSDRGPYLLPNADGSYDEFPNDVYLDWHYAQPDNVICIDTVHDVYGDVLASDNFTDEMHEALVTQIYEYLEKQPTPYTGD